MSKQNWTFLKSIWTRNMPQLDNNRTHSTQHTKLFDRYTYTGKSRIQNLQLTTKITPIVSNCSSSSSLSRLTSCLTSCNNIEVGTFGGTTTGRDEWPVSESGSSSSRKRNQRIPAEQSVNLEARRVVGISRHSCFLFSSRIKNIRGFKVTENDNTI